MLKNSRSSFLYWFIGAALFGGAALWAYWSTLSAMAYKWHNDPQYSQGYLVPAFSGLLLFLRRGMLKDIALRPSPMGLLLVAGGAILHIASGYLNMDWVDGLSLLPVVGGFFWLMGGWPLLLWAWPGVFFLVFMIPLPYSLETALAYPLQRMATVGSTYLLQTCGFSALAEGNIILLSQSRIGVVEACSGLSMLLIFFAIATAIVILYQPPWLDRIVLLLSAIPIAIIVNILRITVTGMAQEWFGEEIAEKIFHDWAGWLMMPMAFGLLILEVWLLRVLFPFTNPFKEKKPLAVPGLAAALQRGAQHP
jgi:exosortase